MNQRERDSLDNYITGHYGEDQYRDPIGESPYPEPTCWLEQHGQMGFTGLDPAAKPGYVSDEKEQEWKCRDLRGGDECEVHGWTATAI